MDFKHKLANAWGKSDSLLCVGLDPDLSKLPKDVKSKPKPLFAFNKEIIDATADLVCTFKPNSAMYEAFGADGISQLKETVDYIKQKYPNIPVLLDFKRGDIGNTNSYYAKFAFDYLGVDAVTISPYLGKQANESFLEYKDRGIFVLCRTSNPGAGEFQDLKANGKTIYRIVAEKVMKDWDYNNNCGLVIGATYPSELAELRQLLGDEVTFLVPGLAAQGGTVEESVKAGINKQGSGIIVNSSREVIYSSDGKDFATAAREKALKLRNEINGFRLKEGKK